jgi:hypothetical protein
MEDSMKKIVFVLFILSAFVSLTFAEDIYTYKDKNGNTVISNTPIPEKYEKKAKKIGSTEQSSPGETQRYQAKPSREVRTTRVQKVYDVQYPSQRQTFVAKKDETCKHECEVNKNICMSDCSRHSSSYKSHHDTDNYERASCNHDCTQVYISCMSGC